MATPLKDLYNTTFFDAFLKQVLLVVPDFDTTNFLEQLLDENWDNLALKQRMRHITLVLAQHLSPLGNYEAQLAVLLEILRKLKAAPKHAESIEYLFLPDYVAHFGLESYATSVAALAEITPFITAEFAVRPFLMQYPVVMLAQMKVWATDPNEHIRRLASEGCRPRLPWGMALKTYQKDPQLILPILELLKNDPSEYVRRSVANNLNDIAKDDPELIIEIAKDWYGNTTQTDALVKHATRTLLKQGNQELMQLFGFGATDQIKIEKLKIKNPVLQLGEYLYFDFELQNLAEKATLIRLEYAIYYLKANGSLSRKVFKISEKEYSAQSTTSIERKQHFKPISTRKYHFGQHQLALIVNGVEQPKFDFELCHNL